MIGEAPHLLDPEELEDISIEDGKQRGLYLVSTSKSRSDESTADFVDSVVEVSHHPFLCNGGDFQHKHAGNSMFTAFRVLPMQMPKQASKKKMHLGDMWLL